VLIQPVRMTETSRKAGRIRVYWGGIKQR